ncbi:MAG: transcription-repair coupling factor [Bacillaceae bacterium]|nr:transcription-repair coupling factor [Bacillaceae bacterium]
MNDLLQVLNEDIDFQSVVTGLDQGINEQMVSGFSQSARHVAMASLYKETGRPQLIVTHNMLQAQKVYDDLAELLPEEDVLLYPANEMIVTEFVSLSPDIVSQRIDVLNRLTDGFKGVLIVPLAGFRKILVPKETWKHARIQLEERGEVNVESLTQSLISLGYDRVEMVENKGEFSIRGGIIDIFPVDREHPLRIELFDVEIDSIRTFDQGTQRSHQTRLEQVAISPIREVFATRDEFLEASLRLEQKLAEGLSTIKDKTIREKLAENMERDIERLREGQFFDGLYKYITLLYPKYHSLQDFLPKNTVMLIDEPSRIMESAKQLEQEESEWITGLMEQGEFFSSLKISFDYQELMQPHRFPVVYFSIFLRQVPGTQPSNIVNFSSKPMQNFHGQMNVLKSELQRWKKANYRILFLAGTRERAKHLERVLHDYKMEVDFVETARISGLKRPVISLGNLQSGFEFPTHRLVVITEGEVFTRRRQKTRKSRQKLSNAEKIKSYLELNQGDYVVHIHHGVGKYVGIETRQFQNGVHKDYLHIQYDGGDSLFVPIDQIDQVQKYVGGDEQPPKVYRLGGNEWKRVKNKVKSSVKDIAADLIKLYAEREASKGYAFEKDGEAQKEFESMFPYEETPDQLKAIEEIKKDMESPRPMDRLLCGDVGYGKTEVAIRAAFKAAIEGKQVAVLVPTTILAQQHYETFKERFSDFPIEIHMLSRFRSRKEMKETVKGIKEGTVDIVIGTHRLLSKDVEFRDLGLLIIDEEQRFGVTHKEKLKKLKANVDALTLTATPIPRTLHMSMLGVRDLSVIETPPENRFPVQTYVMEYSPILVKEAIERELARGGQVYFLYNQVQGIQKMADQVKSLVPEARVAIAHGQMTENELERTMLDFLDGEYDVLVSTTIIETGVDIPNVNTLIVYDADKKGLSQLYQLRGRVGRSNRIAYAYFTYQKDRVLSEVAEKRLQAMKEFTELGSGFKIAMRDLAIRGAGNLLGAEQHGFIASVGFDLYTQMLKDAIDELKGKARAKEEEKEKRPEIDIDLDAYIPSDYIDDSKQKIEMYKKFAACTTMEDVEDLTDELIDRFGDIPQPVLNLLSVSRLRAYCLTHKLTHIKQQNDDIQVFLHPSLNHEIDGGRLFALAARFDQKIALSSGHQIGITFKLKGLIPEEKVNIVEKFLAQFDEVKKEKGEFKHVDIAKSGS